MKILDSCKTTITDSIANKSFAIAHLYKDEKAMSIHIHDCYEIYYSIRGGKQFLIDDRFYDFAPGDIFFINQYESHYLSKIVPDNHERIIISIHPDFLTRHSTEKTDLNNCFTFRDQLLGHRLSLNSEEQKHLMFYYNKIRDNKGYGSDIIDTTTFLELMTFLNKSYISHSQSSDAIETFDTDEIPAGNHDQIDTILSYINNNVENDLTIESLAAQFDLSTSYLCRIFKNSTGTTINKYVTAKRITFAKSLISEGHTAQEVCTMSGFHDYSNFYKSFTKAVGISPRKYGRYAI
ncbi:MAG: AraC family transcriptional regulator [Suipraeoptans sp.]